MPTTSITIGTRAAWAEIEQSLRRPEQHVAGCPDVVSVQRTGSDSRWELRFRGTPLRWTQTDVVSHDGKRGRFSQTEGDFTELSGSWRVGTRDELITVGLEIIFRTSVAHLAGAFDPMIARVLLRTAVAFVTASCPDVQVIEGGDQLRDLPAGLVTVR